MTLSDLIEEARTDILDDGVAPYLWSDAQLTRYAQEALKEAGIRAGLFRKASAININTGVTSYALENTTRQIQRVVDADGYDLTQATEADLSINYGLAWRSREGKLKHYIRRGHTFIVFPSPTKDQVIQVLATHIPGDNFNIDEDMDPAYLRGLLYFIAYKAYSLNDADTNHSAKAAEHYGLFEGIFGPRHTAKYDQFAFDTPMYARLEGVGMA